MKITVRVSQQGGAWLSNLRPTADLVEVSGALPHLLPSASGQLMLLGEPWHCTAAITKPGAACNVTMMLLKQQRRSL